MQTVPITSDLAGYRAFWIWMFIGFSCLAAMNFWLLWRAVRVLVEILAVLKGAK